MLAIVTAIVSTHGGGSPAHVIDGYRTALEVITGVSAAGLLVVLSGVLRSLPVGSAETVRTG